MSPLEMNVETHSEDSLSFNYLSYDYFLLETSSFSLHYYYFHCKLIILFYLFFFYLREHILPFLTNSCTFKKF